MIEMECRVELQTGTGGGKTRNQVFNVYNVSVWNDEKVLLMVAQKCENNATSELCV